MLETQGSIAYSKPEFKKVKKAQTTSLSIELPKIKTILLKDSKSHQKQSTDLKKTTFNNNTNKATGFKYLQTKKMSVQNDNQTKLLLQASRKMLQDKKRQEQAEFLRQKIKQLKKKKIKKQKKKTSYKKNKTEDFSTVLLNDQLIKQFQNMSMQATNIINKCKFIQDLSQKCQKMEHLLTNQYTPNSEIQEVLQLQKMKIASRLIDKRFTWNLWEVQEFSQFQICQLKQDEQILQTLRLKYIQMIDNEANIELLSFNVQRIGQQIQDQMKKKHYDDDQRFIQDILFMQVNTQALEDYKVRQSVRTQVEGLEGIGLSEDNYQLINKLMQEQIGNQ